MRTSAQILVGASFALLVGACGNDQASQDANQAIAQLTKAASEMAQQAQQMAGGAAGPGGKQLKPVPPVSYKKLIDYLPKKLDGMKANEPEGETASAGPQGQWQYSEAKVNFNGEQGVSANAGIFDYAHISLMYIPYQMMTRMKINKESTSGYERTTEMDGFPAYEEWNKNSKNSEMTVLVGDRFIVHTQVNGGEEGAAKQVMDRIDLKGLAKETSH
jgi:hypothetical protein